MPRPSNSNVCPATGWSSDIYQVLAIRNYGLDTAGGPFGGQPTSNDMTLGGVLVDSGACEWVSGVYPLGSGLTYQYSMTAGRVRPTRPPWAKLKMEVSDGTYSVWDCQDFQADRTSTFHYQPAQSVTIHAASYGYGYGLRFECATIQVAAGNCGGTVTFEWNQSTMEWVIVSRTCYGVATDPPPPNQQGGGPVVVNCTCP